MWMASCYRCLDFLWPGSTSIRRRNSTNHTFRDIPLYECSLSILYTDKNPVLYEQWSAGKDMIWLSSRMERNLPSCCLVFTKSNLCASKQWLNTLEAVSNFDEQNKHFISSCSSSPSQSSQLSSLQGWAVESNAWMSDSSFKTYCWNQLLTLCTVRLTVSSSRGSWNCGIPYQSFNDSSFKKLFFFLKFLHWLSWLVRGWLDLSSTLVPLSSMEEDIEEGFADYAILKQKKRYYFYSMQLMKRNLIDMRVM